MQPKHYPALILLAVALFAVIGACLSAAGAASTTAEVVGEWAPIPQATADIALDRRRQEAEATTEYLKVLAQEVISDTQNSHAIMRAQEQTRFVRSEELEMTVSKGKRVLVGFGVFGLAMTAVGGGFWLGARGAAAGLKHLADARIPPSRRLPDGANIVEGSGGQWRIVETRAALMRGNLNDDASGDTMAASDVREFQAVVVRAIAEAVVEAARGRALVVR